MPARVALPLIAILLIATPPCPAQALPGTDPWEHRGDPAADMVAGLARYLDRRLAESVRARQARWHRDTSSPAAYERSIAPNRARLATILGAVDPRVSPVNVSLDATTDEPAKVLETSTYRVFAVRWPVYRDVEAEGLLLEPIGQARADVVAIGDADTKPEELAGMLATLPPRAQTARLLVQAGCRVLVPTLLDRADEFSGNPNVRMTNLTHREWIYRMSYEVGRHALGYEVDEVRSAVDWFTRPGQARRPIGVVGYGEGGLVALHAAALDTRIDAAWVGGSFGPREGVWKEPVYRNVWSLLAEFGDAEVATLIAPRSLLVEACRGPEVAGPPPPRNGRADAAKGRLTTPDPDAVAAEVARARPTFEALGKADALRLVRYDDPKSPANADDRARALFLGAMLKIDPTASARDLDHPPYPALVRLPAGRMERLVRQLEAHSQTLARTSELRRAALWSKADTSTPARWAETTAPLRERFHDEVIGRLPPASEPLKARSWRAFDGPKWTGYAVEIPVWPDVGASGVLLLPKHLKPGEKRPVVVCQHGLEGTPEPVVNPRVASVYNAFGAKLADRGYIVYAPQNPYIGHDAFRDLQRRANPLGATLFSIIVRQHERTLEWLATLPQVDAKRIAFYGLSYGGKTAMRVPAILPGYCLSICSADFNEWVVKCTNIDRQYSYMYTIEHDMYEFGLADGFNYAEMAGLIAPRPFLVERGHDDGVAPDEWIGYEFAKVRRTYDRLGLGDRAGIAYFNGGHMIDGRASFEFLDRNLGLRNSDRGLGNEDKPK